MVNSGNSGVKNKMLDYGSILTGKRYVVQIYEIELHNKINVDWIKNNIQTDARFLVTGIPDPLDILKFLSTF